MKKFFNRLLYFFDNCAPIAGTVIGFLLLIIFMSTMAWSINRNKSDWKAKYPNGSSVSFSGLRGVIVDENINEHTITVLIDGTRNTIKLNVYDTKVIILSEDPK